MSGLEVVAVIGAVAAVVSAYKDGSRIVAEIKQKRARKKAPPPTKYLEESLSRGPPAVEEAKNNGVERFGQAFAIGDSKSLESQDIMDICFLSASSFLKPGLRCIDPSSIPLRLYISMILTFIETLFRKIVLFPFLR